MHHHSSHRCNGRGSLVEPALLAALLNGDAHGYDLKRSIHELTENTVPVDVGGLYRTLRRLEDDGFVSSTWIEGGSGPQRRDYHLTQEGRELAEEWAQLLHERSRITAMLAETLDAATGRAAR